MEPDNHMAGGEEEDVDELARLRAADPVPSDVVDALSTSARARALRAELTMQTDPPPTAPTPPTETQPAETDLGAARRWRRAVLAGAALVALALGSTAVVLELSRDAVPADTVADPGAPADPEVTDDDRPQDTAEPVTSGGMALCAFMYGPDTLVEREFAFAGTVTGVDGDAITFDVEESFRGDLGDPVTLGGAEFLTTPNPDNPTPVTVGDRLLVAGDGGFAWGCGFTQAHDEEVAATWRDAFAG